MYCEKHDRMIRCCSLQESECVECGKRFITFNAPPVNKLCKECGERTGRCEYCGEKIR